MSIPSKPDRRYPLRAVFAVAAAALFVLGEIAFLAVWMMPLVPLVPVVVLIVLGNAFVLSDIVAWAASLARPPRLESESAAATLRDATQPKAGAQAL